MKKCLLWAAIFVWGLNGCSEDVDLQSNESKADPNVIPFAENDEEETDSATPVDIEVLKNDRDWEGQELTIVDFTQPSHGRVRLNENNTFTYTPRHNFEGDDFFTYQIFDGDNGLRMARVKITVTFVFQIGGPYLPYFSGKDVFALDKHRPDRNGSTTKQLYKQPTLSPNSPTVFTVHSLSHDQSGTRFDIGDPEVMFYAEDHNFFKVDLSQGSDLKPFQLEPVTNSFDELCKLNFAVNTISIKNNLMYFELPGKDADCTTTGDNERRLLIAGQDKNFGSVPFNHVTDSLESVTPIMDRNNPKDPLIGFIAKVGNFVRHNDGYNYSSTTIRQPNDNSLSRFDYVPFTEQGGYIRLDNDLYWYNVGSRKLSQALHTINSGHTLSKFVCDTVDCYFMSFADNTPGVTVYRISVDGSTAATLLSTSGQDFGVTYEWFLTTNYIYVHRRDNHELFSIARSDGAILKVDSGIHTIFSTNQQLFYNSLEDAFTRSWDGELIHQHLRARWAGTNYIAYDVNTGYESEYVFLMRKADNEIDFSNAMLESYDPVTHELIMEIDILPPETKNLWAIGYGHGELIGSISVGSAAADDIVWFHPGYPMTLERITEDPQRQVPIVMF